MEHENVQSHEAVYVKILIAIVLLGIGFFAGMEYKSYQIRSVIADSFLPAITSSLDDARIKGNDAATKANLSNGHVQAELFWDSNKNSYSGLCSNAEFLKIIEDAERTSGGVSTCNVSPDGKSYAAAIPLKSDSSTSYCIDSTGFAKVVNYSLGSATSCAK